MNLPFLIGLSFNGLAMGLTYALLSMGLILLIRATDVLNFSQGDFVTMGGYVTYYFLFTLNLPMLPGLFLSILVFAFTAILFMLVTYLPVRHNKWTQTRMVCTMGASVIIKELLPMVTTRNSRTMPAPIPGAFRVGLVSISYHYIMIVGVCLLSMLITYVLFDKLYVGRAMMAAAQNPYAAELIGIPTVLTISATYIIVLVLSGIAGWLIVPTFILNNSLNLYQTRAFAGCVIGGFGDLKGALIGSILIGIVEVYATLVSTLYKDVIVYAILLLVLVLKPTGLFSGGRVGVKV